jgi:hypothetical protein
VRHWEIIPQFAERSLKVNLADMSVGWALFFIGLYKKVLLADPLSGYVAATVATFCLNLGLGSNSSQWAFDINQKKRLLAAQPGSPKLLVVGGSALSLALAPGRFKTKPVFRTINLGTHAGLETSYILHLAQEAARPGDTVLLIPEYELYTYGKIERASANSLLLDYIVARDPAFFHSLSPLKKWNVFMFTP